MHEARKVANLLVLRNNNEVASNFMPKDAISLHLPGRDGTRWLCFKRNCTELAVPLVPTFPSQNEDLTTKDRQNFEDTEQQQVLYAVFASKKRFGRSVIWQVREITFINRTFGRKMNTQTGPIKIQAIRKKRTSTVLTLGYMRWSGSLPVRAIVSKTYDPAKTILFIVKLR
jgi:hypothetical protein